MSNEMFEELEKAISEEVKAKNLNITIEVKGFKDGGFLIQLSRTNMTKEESKKYQEATSNAWNKIKKKWFKEL